MTSLVNWVLLYSGVPPEAVFGDTRGQGTPIVIDTVEDIAYYLKPGVGVTPLGGGGSGIQYLQFAGSDMGSDLVVQTEVGYITAQSDIGIYKWGASLVYAGSTETEVDVLVNGISVLETPIVLSAGETVAEFPQELRAYASGTRFIANITVAGTGAKGLAVFASGLEQ